MNMLFDKIEDARSLAQIVVETVREPLLAPPAGTRWRLAWSSESPPYGGQGTPAIDLGESFVIPAETALLFVPETGTDDVGNTDGTRSED